MAKLYIRQHKRGRKSYYTGIPRGSSFFCCFGALWGFSADFSTTLEEIRKKARKVAILGDFPPLAAREILFRHYTIKLFSFGDWQAKKADFSKE